MTSLVEAVVEDVFGTSTECACVTLLLLKNEGISMVWSWLPELAVENEGMSMPWLCVSGVV